MTDQRDIVKRNLRCVRMQIDDREPIYAEAAAEITALRARAEAAEKRVAELEAALRPLADGRFLRFS